MSNVGIRRTWPIQNDEFQGGSNITGGEGGLEDRLNQLYEEKLETSYNETHLYANATIGSDSNDGTENNPVKTIGKLFTLIKKYTLHNTTLHLKGVFESSNEVNPILNLTSIIDEDVNFLIDGGDELEVIAGPFTADIESTSSIGLSTAGWTPDEYAGYWVEITDPASPVYGQMRLIHSHDATTIVPCKNWGSSPGNVTFRIVRPATILNGTSNFIINCKCFYNTPVFQRITLTGKTLIRSLSGSSGVHIRSIVSDSTLIFSVQAGVSVFASYPNYIDPNTYIQNNDIYLPMSIRNASSLLKITDNNITFVQGGYFRKIEILNCNINSLIAYGCRVNGSVVINNSITGTSSAFQNNSGYAQSLVSNPSGIGININNSNIEMKGIDISDCGSHGIELNDSKLIHTGDNNLSGTNNTGAGVYVHSGGKMQIADGSPPTITGNVGGGADISLDGTTQASTWSAIDGGTPINGATVGNDEFVLVKEV